MPKVWQKYTKSESLIGLWEITEDEQALIEAASTLPDAELRNPVRRRHWLASRALLRDLLQEMGESMSFAMTKNEFGSPMLHGSTCKVSISHSGDYAAIGLSRQSAIGIDVERISPRIERIREKFMNEQELAQLGKMNDLAHMHLIWSAKEALFKYHPEPQFDFRKDLHIDRINADHLDARITKGEREQHLEVPYTWHEDYVLAWALSDI